MNKLTAIAVAALLSISAPVMAQSATTNLSASDPALPTESNSDFGLFMEGFGTADFTTAVDSLDSATSVNIIKLSGMTNADATTFEAAASTRADDLTALRSRVAANAKAKAALDAGGWSADNVVAIQGGADGVVTIYVNDL